MKARNHVKTISLGQRR